MKIHHLICFLLISSCTCNSTNKTPTPPIDKEELEMAFDFEKWNLKNGNIYPFREQMVNSILFDDSLRQLSKDEIVETLGEPNRQTGEYIYYEIERSKLLFMTMYTRTLVIKFDGQRVEWMKVHE